MEFIMKTENAHYVNNADFSKAVVDYVRTANEAKKNGEKRPIVTDYIAQCFLKISEGLSHKANFARYTYREEMVMDAVENCLKAIENYDVDVATRTGNPNAFAYFTQIAWYAFLRRIAKEKKQQEIKLKYLTESNLTDFMIDSEEDPEVSQIIQSFIDNLKKRIDEIKENDKKFDEYKKEYNNRRKQRSYDSDLMDFFLNEEEDE